MTVEKTTSLDLGYEVGDLSLYPAALDSKKQLYEVRNNAETTLKQSLTYTGKYVVVENNDKFPDSGILRVGPPHGEGGTAELIYYEKKSTGVFKDLIRGFAGSQRNPWPVGSYVGNAVFAEIHNTLKDALINIETNLGVETQPDEESLNGILSAQERRFMAPRPLFRAYPIKGAPPLKVRFQNFSTGPLIRYLWDFGDGTTSVEKHPTHTYQKEGIYTVKLNVITSLGAQGITTKSNYIVVDDEEKIPFFYVTPAQGYSRQTADSLDIDPTEFTFVDQTDGDIVQRYWIFDGPGKHDGETVEGGSIGEFDPNIHTTTYVYDLPGTYEPSLLLLFESQKLKRAFLRDEITVL